MSSYRFDLENAIAACVVLSIIAGVLGRRERRAGGQPIGPVEALVEAGLSVETGFREAMRRMGS